MTDAEMDKILDVPFVFWICPKGCRGQVEWNEAKDDATCLECGMTRSRQASYDLGCLLRMNIRGDDEEGYSLPGLWCKDAPFKTRGEAATALLWHARDNYPSPAPEAAR